MNTSIYEVDGAMMGSDWDRGPEGLRTFCEILQGLVEDIEIVAITDSLNGAGENEVDVPMETWNKALEAFYDLDPEDAETVTYGFIRDCTGGSGTWVGSRQEALKAAVDALDASPAGDDEWRYYADETSSSWLVEEDDMVRLGAALLSGYDMSECYSLWCSESVAQEEIPEEED